MLTTRSLKKELIDLGPAYYTQDEYVDCLKKLFNVSKFLGIFKRTAKILTRFAEDSSLVDIGCGGGLFLLHLSKKFSKMKMVGFDINAEAINESQKTLCHWQKQNLAHFVSFQLQTQPNLLLPKNSIDIILANFVCHHLNDDELINFLQQAYKSASKAVIINDLHRSRLAALLYAIFSPFLFRNRLISHDGFISIQRGFNRTEWKALLKAAQIKTYQIKWRFPFQWNVILWKNTKL